MVHDDYKEMIPARALSALDAAEERALNEHLENCAECRKELEDWQATAAALSLTPDPAEPSPQVRERILSEVRKDQSSSKPEVIPFRSKRNIWSSFGSLGAMAAVLLFIALIIGLIVLWKQNRATQERLARANEFIELVNTPGARVTELTDVLGRGETAKLAYDRNGRVMLMATKFPGVPLGKAFQLWFIVANKPPVPGKTFLPDNTGGVVLKDEIPRDAIDANVFAVTVEPAGGSTVPTGPIYLRSL